MSFNLLALYKYIRTGVSFIRTRRYFARELNYMMIMFRRYNTMINFKVYLYLYFIDLGINSHITGRGYISIDKGLHWCDMNKLCCGKY